MIDIEKLIVAHLNDEATTEEVKQLFEWIQMNPENAKEFARQSLLHAQLRGRLSGEFLAQKSSEKEKVFLEKHTLPVGAPGQLDFDPPEIQSVASSLSRPKKTRRTVWTYVVGTAVSIAVGLMVAAYMTDFQPFTPSAGPIVENELIVVPDPIDGENDLEATKANNQRLATVANMVDVAWAADTEFTPEAPGAALTAGTLKLESGFLRLRFNMGVDVTIEGPASLELVSSYVTKLDYGLLVATVPPGGEGFQVDTPTTKVVDLGTAFGLQVDRDGVSLVSVFDGRVDVSAMVDVDDPAATQHLKEGESVRVGANDSIASIDFESLAFAEIWPQAVGIGSINGDCRFTSPWPRALRMLQGKDEIFLMPEGYATRVSDSLKVDIAEPGVYGRVEQMSDSEISFGTDVRSYLLQYNPKQAVQVDEQSRIVGQVTFDRPILGLIVLGETLAASDLNFSDQPQMFATARRQIELIDDPSGEVVTLSDDRRTVTVNLAFGGRSSDHVRVIVDDSSPPLNEEEQ